MDKPLDKHRILESAIRQHETVINDFRERIREMMHTDENENEERFDSQTQALKAETTAKVSLLAEQLSLPTASLRTCFECGLKWAPSMTQCSVDRWSRLTGIHFCVCQHRTV